MTKNTFTHVISIAFAIIFGLLISSCKSKSEIKIGLLVPTSVGGGWSKDQKIIEERIAAMGATVITKLADNDEIFQMQQCRELIKQKVDVIILIPVNQITAANIVREAQAKGIKVVACGRIVKNCDLDFFVASKGEDIGQMMIDYALQLKPTGNYVMLYGDAMDANAVSIQSAQEKALKPYIDDKRINIVYKGYQDEWSQEYTKENMMRVLDISSQKIDAVITSFSKLALGAFEAFEETETPYKSNIIFTTQDSELDACKKILDGKLTVLLYKSRYNLANATVDVALKLARNQKITAANAAINNGRKDVPAIMLKPIVVDINTMKSVLTSDELKYVDQISNSQ